MAGELGYHIVEVGIVMSVAVLFFQVLVVLGNNVEMLISA